LCGNNNEIAVEVSEGSFDERGVRSPRKEGGKEGRREMVKGENRKG
jgi:hypothetical protein